MKPLDEPQMARQVAALPIRRQTGGIEVLLVTTLDTGRWVIPKGWPWPDRPDHRAAAEEAWEEGGVTGDISSEPLGTYDYGKRRKGGLTTPVRVAVYVLEVAEEKGSWPEQNRRQRQWVSPEDAAGRVREPELKELILSLRQRA